MKKVCLLICLAVAGSMCSAGNDIFARLGIDGTATAQVPAEQVEIVVVQTRAQKKHSKTAHQQAARRGAKAFTSKKSAQNRRGKHSKGIKQPRPGF